MKIAFIDHLPVGTGIIRFATKLAKSIVDCHENIEISYFTHWSNFQKNKELFKGETSKLTIKLLRSTFPESKINSYRKKIFQKVGIPIYDKLQKELEAIKGFDIIYFTSAHMSKFYNVEGRKFATFHDFNWKYSFGVANFSKSDIKVFNSSMPSWFASTVPIVSTNFIKKEIDKFYPLHQFPIEVIHLPNMGNEVKDSSKKIYDFPYILYPANVCAHKNHLNLYHGLNILKEECKLNGTKLILTGAGTDHFQYGKLSALGLEEGNYQDFDVLGLGYVNNNVMDSLIKHADLNISVSLYEAGSGPAIDAWINEVPFMMSDIESHKNQLEFFNLDCLLVNPFSPYDIAEKIDFALNNLDTLKISSRLGHEALKKYNWNLAAMHYLNVFTKYTNGN